MLDPALALSIPTMNTVHYAIQRKDLWPNREAAIKSRGFMPKSWDPRCQELFARYALRNLPTALYPDLPEGSNPNDPPVTLTTVKYQDAVAQIRETFDSVQQGGNNPVISRLTHADMNPVDAGLPVYRPEPSIIWHRISTLRPPVLFVLASKPLFNIKEVREAIRNCGTGVGGSGGIAESKVQEILLDKCGHMFPFEIIGETAEYCANWLGKQMHTFRASEREWGDKRSKMSARDHLVPNKAWLTKVSGYTTGKPRQSKV